MEVLMARRYWRWCGGDKVVRGCGRVIVWDMRREGESMDVVQVSSSSQGEVVACACLCVCCVVCRVE